MDIASSWRQSRGLVVLLAIAAGGLPGVVHAQEAAGPPKKDEEKPDFRPWAEVAKGYTKVVTGSQIGGGDEKSLWTLWVKEKDGSLIAELPAGWANQKYFIATTIAAGDTYAGLQFGETYCYWKRVDTRMVLVEPNVGRRSTGDNESKVGTKMIFTDRVILDLPIVAMGPSGQPAIDLKTMLVGKADTFFSYMARGANASVATLKKAKAFPQNLEIAYEMPVAGGTLREFHYSISVIPDATGYKPREADLRVGYFTTSYLDLGKMQDKEKWTRYINRWWLEKRDPSLDKSPPKQPIVYYIDAATPVRYRQAVREGVLAWNSAFEQIGIVNAIEVYQQDEATGANMDKDPEDVRYNFVRWLTNDQGTAIGPSRTHPLTGQILDADVVLTDGWVRYWWNQFNEMMPELAMEGMSAETLAWLETRPQWDPRVRLADPAQRPLIMAQRSRRGVTAYGGHPIALVDPAARAWNQRASQLVPFSREGSERDALAMRMATRNGMCMMSHGRAFDLAMGKLTLELLQGSDVSLDDGADDGAGDGGGDEAKKDDAKENAKDAKKKKVPMIDGVPEWFVLPLLKDLTMHEVGHTLGLRHNFKGSTMFTLAEMNGPDVKGKQPFAASVMDYIPINMNVENGKLVGDIGMIDIGVYDRFAIEYGYTLGDHKEVLKRVGEKGLAYGTDEDADNADPTTRRYDFSKEPLDYAKSLMELARFHRGRLIDKFVKDGESWARVRRGYTITLGMQTRALNMMSSWVGGAIAQRYKKGDANNVPPVNPVPVQQQRDALAWVLENAFEDDAFGLTPELVGYLTVDKWSDEGGFREAMQEPNFPIHDRIGGIQASVMTMLLNPSTVRRIYDNELAVPASQDFVTLPEVLDSVGKSVWKELDRKPSGSSARKPYISSLRRNLQREHIDRLIDLSLPTSFMGEASKPVSNLVTTRLRELRDRITDIIGKEGKDSSGLDPYSFAHLAEAKIRIERALDAQYVYNADQIGGGGGGFFFFGESPEAPRSAE